MLTTLSHPIPKHVKNLTPFFNSLVTELTLVNMQCDAVNRMSLSHGQITWQPFQSTVICSVHWARSSGTQRLNKQKFTINEKVLNIQQALLVNFAVWRQI